MATPGFWQKEQEEISRMSQERAWMQEQIDAWQRLRRETEDARILAEMAFEEQDEKALREVRRDVARLRKEIQRMELTSLLGDPDDKRNAIVAINAGAGGPRPRTGSKCCSGCTPGGQRKRAWRSR